MSNNEAASIFWSKYSTNRPSSDVHPKQVGHPRKPHSGNWRSRGPGMPQQKFRTEKITNVPALLRQIRIGLSNAQGAAKCIVGENRDAQYDVNTIKWCRTICQETRKLSVGLLLNGNKPTTDVRQALIQAQAEIDDCHHEFVRLFVSLFSRLASAPQTPNPPKLGDTLVNLVKAFMMTRGQQGGRQEQIWLDGFRELKKLLATLDPYDAIECLRKAVTDCEGQKLAHFYIYSALFQMVWERYEGEWKHGSGVDKWELALSRLGYYATGSMTADFLAIAKSFPSAPPEPSAKLILPEELVNRLSDATRFAEAHSVLFKAHEAAADMSDSAKSTQTKERKHQFNKVIALYYNAYRSLIDIDKASAGFAMARIGFLHWSFHPPNDRSKAIGFLNRALRFEEHVDSDSWWLKKAKEHIAIYDDELRAKEQERLRKEEEEQKRQERSAREAREIDERARCQAMLDNLETLKTKGEGVSSPEGLFAFLEWTQAHFGPPELSAQNQLRQHITEMQNHLRSRRISLKKIRMLYHPDKNGKQGDVWKDICTEVTKV